MTSTTVTQTAVSTLDAVDELHAALEHLALHAGSDLHVVADSTPMARIDGSLDPIHGWPVWSAEFVAEMLTSILTPAQLARFEEELELDFAYSLPDGARFRVNVYRQRGKLGAAFRLIPSVIVPLAELGLPASVSQFAGLQRGLVLVTGPTGSGKSTTLASLVHLASQTRAAHIMTIEDPIEFVHTSGTSLINQREVGTDTYSHATAIRQALRQDPDIILLGELRDIETISAALTAAETGHLVFATLHTQSAAQTVDRIIDAFPADQQDQVRQMLAMTLKGVVSQTLVKKSTGSGRMLAAEVLVVNSAASAMIREGKAHQIGSIMESGRESGMQTMDQHLSALVDADLVEVETAVEYATEPAALRSRLNRAVPIADGDDFYALLIDEPVPAHRAPTQRRVA